MSKRRSGTVDGQLFPSMREIKEFLKISKGGMDRLEESHGPNFDYHGHRIILSPGRAYRPRRQCPLAVAVAPPPPRDPLALALASRRAYDKQGWAPRGLLIRRPA